MLHIKSEQEWPTGLYIRIFWRSRERNSRVIDPIRPKFELVQDFMPVLVTSKWRKSDQNERARWETPFSHYKSTGIFRRSRRLTPKGVFRSGQNSNFSEILCLSSLPASLTKVGSKLKALAWRHRFSQYKTMGAFCCHGNHSFDGICSKT